MDQRKPGSCRRWLFVLTLMGCLPSCGPTHDSSKDEPTPEQLGRGAPPATLKLTSSAFTEGGMIPKLFTADGSNKSPPLAWSDPPAETKSFALICDDPDASGGDWVHWVLFNLPASTRELPEGVRVDEIRPTETKSGQNSWVLIAYRGPEPPAGKAHRYFFKVYALDTTLDLPTGAVKKQVLDACKGHVLAEGQLMGRYQR